jgi:hypothetical protein
VNSQVIELTTFDYMAPEHRDYYTCLTHARDIIRNEMGKCAKSIITIGLNLIDAKNECGHGLFLKWLAAEFGWYGAAVYASRQGVLRFRTRAVFGTDHPLFAGRTVDPGRGSRRGFESLRRRRETAGQRGQVAYQGSKAEASAETFAAAAGHSRRSYRARAGGCPRSRRAGRADWREANLLRGKIRQSLGG